MNKIPGKAAHAGKQPNIERIGEGDAGVDEKSDEDMV
jgi:hypothetical protein